MDDQERKWEGKENQKEKKGEKKLKRSKKEQGRKIFKDNQFFKNKRQKFLASPLP